MAKPRVFISSTYYDLKHIRKSIELFINEVGYESVLFENGDIPFDHDNPLDESCYKELDSCQIFVLIIGGRYGSASSDQTVEPSKDDLEKHYKHFNSITRKEYETARTRDIPIYIFIEKGVSAEYLTYKENKENMAVKYAHVDSVNVFRLIDSLYAEKRNNLVREFENVEDITSWLKDQWAGLFNQFLLNKTSKKQLDSLEGKLTKLGSVIASLQDYSESLIRQVKPEESEKIIDKIQSVKNERDLYNEFVNLSFTDFLLTDYESGKDIHFKAAFEMMKKSSTLTEFLSKAVKYADEVDPDSAEMNEFILDENFFDSELANFYLRLKKNQ